jgi:hypothetical protein
MWYSNVGNKNLYYIDEADMYIKTFPSRETVIIAFSDKKIGKFADTLDYIMVNKGVDYSTVFLLDPNKQKMIYNCGSNSIRNVHLNNYEFEEIPHRDTTYFEYELSKGYLLKFPYVEIAFDLYGATVKLSLKNRNDYFWTEIKPIK